MSISTARRIISAWLTFGISTYVLYAQPSQLQIVQPAPSGTFAPGTAVIGVQTGQQGIFYFVVAHYPIGNVVSPFGYASTVGIQNLNVTNYVTIRWQAADGATSYDVVRNTSPQFPSGCTSCAVVTGTTLLSVNDQGGGSAYTLSNAAANASAAWTLDNVTESAPFVRLQLNNQIYRIAPFSGSYTAGDLVQINSNGILSDSGTPGNPLTTTTLGAVNAQTRFGAVGDDVADDTAALQACIDYVQTHRSTCFLPPAVYKTTGSGLSMTAGQPSLTSWQSEGNGIAVIKYYGTGTALTIGNGTTRLFAINLSNIVLEVADGGTAQYGVVCNNVSGGDWQGLVIGGGATTGVFTTAVRFSDCGGINLRRPIVSDKNYTSGTTGFLFDVFNNFGNDNITITDGDLSSKQQIFNFKSCGNCLIHGTYVENADYMVLVDNTVAWSANSGMDSITFDGTEFNTSGTGPTHHKLLQVNSTTGNSMRLANLTFAHNRVFLSGGVTFPIELNVASMAAFSVLRLNLNDNAFIGAESAVVDSNNTAARVFFGPNFVRAADGTTRTPNLNGTATTTDTAPVNTSDTLLYGIAETGRFFAPSGSIPAQPTVTDPTCTVAGDLGKQWTDSTSSTTTHFKICANVASSPAWVMVF